jgi:hypothetical protein
MLTGVDIEQSPYRRRGFVAAAAMVALIAGSGVVVAIADVIGAHQRRFGVQGGMARTGGRPVVAAAPLSSQEAGACGALPTSPSTVPTSTPTGAEWTLVGDMAEPGAPATLGPERHVRGLGACYAHSPLGALYAAVNVMAAFSSQPQSTVTMLLGVPGAARDAAVRVAVTTDDRDLEQIAGGPSTLIGFAFSSYSAQQAAITLALQGPSGAQVAIPLVMQWVGDDWRFVVPPGGQLAATELQSMAGFVAWGAG